MHDARHSLHSGVRAIHRELFLAAFGANVGMAEAWALDRLSSLLEEEFARAGETLFLAGDPPEFYYFLREGRVELVRNGSAPWVYERRSVFGMSDALLDRPRVRTALALTDVEAMKVQSEAWIELLEDSFVLARAAVLGSVRTVASLEERLWARGVEDPRFRSGPLSSSVRDPRFRSGPLSSSVRDPRFRSGPLSSSVRDPEQDGLLGRLAALSEVPLLRGAGVQILSDLAAASEIVSFARGEVLFERGRPPGRVHLLVAGEVDAKREAPDLTWKGGPGDVVCGTAAFGEPIAAWEASAATAAHALTFRVEDWFDLLEVHFEMVRSTLGALSLDRERLLEDLGAE
jgi:CRP-like cAMP-binding protein